MHLLLFLYCALLPQAAISGRAIDAQSALPVEGATVQLLLLPRRDLVAETTTNPEGAFDFPTVDPGDYILAPSKNAYLPPDPSLPVRITVAAGTPVAVTLAMTLAATITGTAVDFTGAPLPKARVTVTPAVVSASLTDENGDYAITGLPPGAYRVTLYPGPVSAPFLPARAALRVSAGETRKGVDFVVANPHPTAIAGRVTHRPAAWATRTVAVTLFADTEDPGPIAITQADPEGRFHFDAIPAAHYWLTAAGPVSARGPFLAILGEQPHFALQQLDVTGEPIDDLEVPLRPGNTIDGVLRSEDPQCARRAHVSLETPDSVPVPASPWADSRDGASFRMLDVPPNRYRVVVSRLEPGCYVEAVRWQNGALAGQMLPPGVDVHLEIQVSMGTAEFEGTLAEPRTKSLIVLAPLDEGDNVQPAESRVTQSGPDGRYRFTQLKPGRYRIMTLPDIRTVDYLDATYWSTHDSELVVLR